MNNIFSHDFGKVNLHSFVEPRIKRRLNKINKVIKILGLAIVPTYLIFENGKNATIKLELSKILNDRRN